MEQATRDSAIPPVVTPPMAEQLGTEQSHREADPCPACGGDRKHPAVLCHRLPLDGWVCAVHRTGQGSRLRGGDFGPATELHSVGGTILSGTPRFVQLSDNCAVDPDAVTALVERAYKRDGVPTYSVDVCVQGVRAPIIVDGARLSELLERLNDA